MTTRLVLVHALSPLHAGTGQSVGAIDLPIARERPTGIPLVPGSSIKGALRARSADREREHPADVSVPSTRVVFGPDTALASEHAGAVQLSDAQVILLPVRSLAGTFAWVTSPFLLGRFARDAHAAGIALPVVTSFLHPGTPDSSDVEHCLVVGSRLLLQARVVLEDLDLAAEAVSADSPLALYAEKLGLWLFPGASAADRSARESLVARLCLVPDDLMSFLLETATEVTARIRLNETTKTVDRGALWTEEALPTETVLCGLAVASRVERQGSVWTGDQILDHLATVAEGLVQLGGKATVGRGSCLIRWVSESSTGGAA